MTTAPITRALRKSGLQEHTIVEKNARGKAIKVLDGWRLDKDGSEIVLRHTGMNSLGSLAFTHAERTTENYETFTAWLAEATQVLADAGFAVELVKGECRFGTFHQNTAEIIKKIKVIKTEGK